jgi:hypothetical protein
MDIDVRDTKVIISKTMKTKVHYIILRRKVDQAKGKVLYRKGKKRYRIDGLKVYSYGSGKYLQLQQ